MQNKEASVTKSPGQQMLSKADTCFLIKSIVFVYYCLLHAVIFSFYVEIFTINYYLSSLHKK